MERRPRKSIENRTAPLLTAVALVVLLLASIWVLKSGLVSLSDDRRSSYPFVLAAVVPLLCLVGLGYLLISAWAYGGTRKITAVRPDAVILRSGTSFALKAIVDDDRQIRMWLARTRPLGALFLLGVDAEGLEIWHSGGGHATGAINRRSILEVDVTTIHEGFWRYRALEVIVDTGEGSRSVPFVLRSPSILAGLSRKHAIAAQVAVERALALIGPDTNGVRL